MKTAICYYSRHHGNTLKVLEAMAREGEVDLIDVTTRQAVRLDGYDCIGFASGIYAFHFQKSVVEFARQYLPKGKPVFLCTPAAAQKAAARRSWRKLPEKRTARCWVSSGAEGTILSAPSSWWAALPKATPTPPTWKMPAGFTAPLLKNAPGRCRNEDRHSLRHPRPAAA